LQSLAILLLAAGAPADDGVSEFAQLTIEQRVIIRVPLIAPPVPRARPAPPRKPVEWKEKSGPKCIPIKAIRSAALGKQENIDLILTDGQRFRVRFERGCRTMGFYSGFYMQPHEDGRLCGGRDEVQARGGMACEIRDFRKLVPDD